MVGRHAQGWSDAPKPERERRVLATFEALLGIPANEALGYVEEDWSQQIFTGGCPVAGFGPGLAAGAAGLREPTGRLHWAC